MGKAKRPSPSSPQESNSPPRRRGAAAAKTADAAAGIVRKAAKGRNGERSPVETSPTEPKRPHVIRKVASKAQLRLLNPHTDVGEVFVVGSGDCGQLGLGPDVTSKGRPARLDYFAEKEIVDVKAGGLHNLALSRAGEETLPLKVEGLEGHKIVAIIAGDSCSAALTDEGSVFVWGTFRNKNGIFGFRPDIDIQPRPYLIPELKNIISLRAGANHIIAKNREGKVFTFGSGEQGQLGRRIMARNEKESSLIPRPVNRPRGAHGHVVDGFCGGYHTFLKDEKEHLFSFGLNNHGQLGVGDLEEHEAPKEVAGLDPMEGVEMAAGGEHHSVVLNKQGRVYTFGRNDDNQLGIGEGEEAKPSAQLLPEPNNVREISANGAFSLAITNDDGNNLWMWGYGEMGQLANSSEDADTPFQVELKGRHVFRASCGGQHTVMLLRAKET
ncbi:Regulator of chromosome condensation [Blyttiomyces sp. JEL0837]|nr:Regulator of chromosome condensation [Blyttiomyces sp. JEL0837]